MIKYSLISFGDRLYLANLNIKYWGGPDYVVCAGVNRRVTDILEWLKPIRVMDYCQANRISNDSLERDLSHVARIYMQYPDIQIERRFKARAFDYPLSLARHVSTDAVGIYSPNRNCVIGVGGNYNSYQSINQVDFALERVTNCADELRALQSALLVVGVKVEIP